MGMGGGNVDEGDVCDGTAATEDANSDAAVEGEVGNALDNVAARGNLDRGALHGGVGFRGDVDGWLRLVFGAHEWTSAFPWLRFGLRHRFGSLPLDPPPTVGMEAWLKQNEGIF